MTQKACSTCVHAAHEEPCRERIAAVKGRDFQDRICGCATIVRCNHYAYCKDGNCTGCLPTNTELARMRCIEQTPTTKTRDGALEVLIRRGDDYRSIAFFARKATFLERELEALKATL